MHHSLTKLHEIPVSALKGVGDVLAKRLAKLALFTVHDLLFHFPLRYEDRATITPIDRLMPGQYATVIGNIVHTETVTSRRKMLLCKLADETDVLTLRFLALHPGLKQALIVGQTLTVYGEVKRGKFGAEMIHPQFSTTIAEKATSGVDKNASLTPVYPTTEGISQTKLRQLTQQAMQYLRQYPLPDYRPDFMQQHVLTLSVAIETLHYPPQTIDPSELAQRLHPAQQRLIIDELLAHHLSLLAIRAQTQCYPSLPLMRGNLILQFLAQLPFQLTQAQQRVFDEIEQDLANPYPMMRLIQGDVGSGKTVVAALSALLAIEQQQQVVIMAPTELLSEQHFSTFQKWLTPLGMTVCHLSGKQNRKAYAMQCERIAKGEIDLVIGTHAVFQEKVNFHQLALVIIDEQHRFGVVQRQMLWEKGKKNSIHPHLLVMTATPIPRTLAMVFYADLAMSIIDELPPGRTPVKTVTIPNTRRAAIIERINHACLQGRQAYWVCTLIDESEHLEAEAAEVTAQKLREQLPILKLGLIHGRMKPDEKQRVMQRFHAGDIQLLIATTVIEVGVDVPNASLMIIENSERLGLAQLHQLRGRVGRGTLESHCILLYQTPLGKTAQKRLQVMRNSNDGFYISQEDLAIRGAGEILGTKQTGSITFKMADLEKDQSLIPQIQQLAQKLHQHYPDNAKQLTQFWLQTQVSYLRT